MRYERVPEGSGDDSNSSRSSSSSSSANNNSMSSRQKVLSFPLESDLQEVELPALAAGRYVVCAEAVRSADGAVLEEQCFVTRVRGSSKNGDGTEEGEEGDDGSFFRGKLSGSCKFSVQTLRLELQMIRELGGNAR